MTRMQEILDATDHLITVHDDWEADPDAPDVPTLLVERAIEGLIEVCDLGDVPGPCRELVDNVRRLAIEWERYVNGSLRSADQRPAGSFWGAFRAVLRARAGATPYVPVYPEPLQQLMEQRVPDHQILLIYGGADGPLANDVGRLDHRKVQKELAEPGSVIPENWQHPDEVARRQRIESESARRLTAIEDRENSDGGKVDPASIEDLLREGQYPDVVAKVKAVPIEEVLEVAAKLQAEGVSINDRGNLAAMRAPHEHAILPEADAALQPQPPRQGTPEEEQPATPAATETATQQPAADAATPAVEPEDVDTLITLVAEANPGLGAGELVDLLRDEHEANVSVQKVSAVLRKQKEPAGAA